MDGQTAFSNTNTAVQSLQPYPTPHGPHLPLPPQLLRTAPGTAVEDGVSQPAAWRRYQNRSDGAREDVAHEAGSAAASDADISRNLGGCSICTAGSAPEAEGEGLRHFRQNGFGDTFPHARVFSIPQVQIGFSQFQNSITPLFVSLLLRLVATNTRMRSLDFLR